MSYDDYKLEIIADINACMDALQAQPILFMGSGISQRYFGAPTWNDLMKYLSKTCPLITKRFEYYQQSFKRDNTKIASSFSEIYSEWAWEEEQNTRYPSEYFEEACDKDIYIKHEVSTYLDHLIESFNIEDNNFKKEIIELKKINPHAIITTNYDNLMELIFPDYCKIVGQKVVHLNYTSYGEILKIHGCSEAPDTVVLTSEDYENFNKKKKYLSAKLLTYFAEHPLFFFGYSIADENIKGILSDIDEILAPNNELIPNIYMICYDKQCELKGVHPKEQLIAIDDNRSVRLKVIYASNFQWLYTALANCTPDVTVNPKLIRALLSKTYKLASQELPKQELPFNFKMLQSIADDDSQLPTLFGITQIPNHKAINNDFNFTITSLAEKLNLGGWHHVNNLLKEIDQEKDFNIKSSDNIYHIHIRAGERGNGIHKYSNEAYKLLTKVKNKEDYNIIID